MSSRIGRGRRGRGTRLESGGARRMKLKSSREIWLRPTNIGRQTNGVGMSKGLERVNGT